MSRPEGTLGADDWLQPVAPWQLPALLLGVVAGAALQLQQPGLWSAGAYAALLCAALVVGWCGVTASRPRRLGAVRHARGRAAAAAVLVLLAAAMAMAAVSGLRATAYLQQGLNPALEGLDIRVSGVVSAMPQTNEAGTRLRLEVESALLQGTPVQLPPRIEVAWYGGAFARDAGDVVDLQRQPAPVRAGERWEMTVRLKAPHGLRNPHGFDFELWSWEQGVQATGYVRAGPRDEPPRLWGTTWQHPMEQLRQSVRDALLDRLGRGADEASDPGRARIAGVVAALVTGDQRAIDLEADIKVENWASL